MLVFEERGKPEYPEENLLEQGGKLMQEPRYPCQLSDLAIISMLSELHGCSRFVNISNSLNFHIALDSRYQKRWKLGIMLHFLFSAIKVFEILSILPA